MSTYPGIMISDIIITRYWDLQGLLYDGISKLQQEEERHTSLINKDMKLGRTEFFIFFYSVRRLIRFRKQNLVDMQKGD